MVARTSAPFFSNAGFFAELGPSFSIFFTLHLSFLSTVEPLSVKYKFKKSWCVVAGVAEQDKDERLTSLALLLPREMSRVVGTWLTWCQALVTTHFAAWERLCEVLRVFFFFLPFFSLAPALTGLRWWRGD